MSGRCAICRKTRHTDYLHPWIDGLRICEDCIDEIVREGKDD